jgi:hypothetical protein
MTTGHCSRKTRIDSTAYAMAFVAGLWILLNALASVYVVRHADQAGVRQFLERMNAPDAPALPRYGD